MAAAAVAALVSSTEQEPDRCGSEEENRGVEAGDGGQQPAGPAAPGCSRLSKLPLARIKALMKSDPDVSLASQESVFIIAKATVSPRTESPLRERAGPVGMAAVKDAMR